MMTKPERMTRNVLCQREPKCVSSNHVRHGHNSTDSRSGRSFWSVLSCLIQSSVALLNPNRSWSGSIRLHTVSNQFFENSLILGHYDLIVTINVATLVERIPLIGEVAWGLR